MTNKQRIQAISINLLRIAEWHYKDPEANAAVCQRQLEQSKQLAKHLANSELVNKISELSFDNGESIAHQAERCLTLAVLLQAKA